MKARFPTAPDELSAPVLSAALGRDVRHFVLVPIGAGRGNLGDIVRIDFGDGSPSLVAKFAADRADNLAAARRSGLFEREVEFYRRLAPHLGVRVPACHAAEYDRETARFFLLLEHVASDGELDTILGIGPDMAEAVLAELASLHEAGRRFPAQPWLQDMRNPDRIDNLTLLVERGWPRLAALCPDLVSMDEGDQLVARVPVLLEHMAGLDQTIVHGDAKPDNMQLAAGRVALLDWQAVGYGPPAWDVASAMITCLTIEDRRTHEARLLGQYPHDLTGYEEALLFGLVVAAALTVLGDPDEPRRVELVRTMAERSAAALEDHGVR